MTRFCTVVVLCSRPSRTMKAAHRGSANEQKEAPGVRRWAFPLRPTVTGLRGSLHLRLRINWCSASAGPR